MNDEKTIGQVAYEAHNEGLPHDWQQVDEPTRARWESAANAVIDFYDPEGELIDAEFEAESDDDAEG